MSVPYTDAEWSEIIPGLFQGGHFYDIAGQQFTTVLRGVRKFDRVVSLYTLPWAKSTVPDEDIPHTVYEFRDDIVNGLDEETIVRLNEIAGEVAAQVEMGEKVLVRCQAGYNRSGVVCALALMRMGMSPIAAIGLLRDRRSQLVLCNEKFEEYILSQ